MGGKHKEREKRRSRDRSRDKERDKGRDKRKRSRDRDRDRERRRSKSRDKERDRESRKNRTRKSRSRSRSRERKHRDRSRESERRRPRSSRSPSHQSLSQVPVASPPNNNHLTSLLGPGPAGLMDIGAANFLPPRNNFMNLFGGNTDLALMEQELALNPHLLQRLAQESDLSAQLMKFNNELVGLGGNSNSSLTGVTERQLPSLMATPASYEASNSCDNSQDAFHGLSAAEERRRKKKSRWGGSDNEKTFIPGMPTVLPSTLSADQQEAYLVQLQIEEISRKLRTGELGINLNEKERSPSPEPIYSSDGKRLNTREFRTKKKLEEQRHQLVVRMQCMNPDFKPPTDYKPPVIRVSDKVLIPQEEHPDINFVGLLIGPRGNTLKAMEKDTGAKIIIRGKGSVKEGKVGRKDGQPLPGEDEPLHAFITASTAESVKKAVDRIKDVIKQGIEVPEGHNDLRRMQLRELAQLNGTLRETDTPRCNNCGSTEHKSWLCPDKPNVTNNILCSLCGGAGHIAKDCRSKKTGIMSSPNKIDEEYMSLMAELGEGPPPESQSNNNNHNKSNSRFGLFEQRQAPRSLMGSSHNQHHHHHNHHHHNQHHQHQQQVHQAPPIPQQAQPPPPPWNQLESLPVSPPIPPPPVGQPPLPAAAAAPPPLMPWMQPPPPGMEPQWPAAPAPPGTQPLLPAPPGTQPMIPAPPPPGTQSMIPAQFSWMGLPPSFATPPLPLAPPPPPPPPV